MAGSQNGSANKQSVILRRRLTGHDQRVFRLTWDREGQQLFSSGEDKTLRIWDVGKGQEARKAIPSSNFRVLDWTRDGRVVATDVAREGDVRVRNLHNSTTIWEQTFHKDAVNSVAWSPNHAYLATASADYTAIIWEMRTRSPYRTYDHMAEVTCLAWSPNGKRLASGTGRGRDNRVRVFNLSDDGLILMPKGHTAGISCLAWHPSGRYLASGSSDRTIRIWDLRAQQEVSTLEGHTDTITSLAFSPDGTLLASKAQDETARLWSEKKNWELVKILREQGADYAPSDLIFHPTRPLLASANLNAGNGTIDIYEINMDTIHDEMPDMPLVYYRNAKVVLVGEGKAGKTTLGHALIGESTENLASTHGVNVWRFNVDQATYKHGWGVKREIYLWDLSGQDQYRLIHQLYLKEVALALLVFDGTRGDSLSAIRYWSQALKHIPSHQPQEADAASFIHKLLDDEGTSAALGAEQPIKFLVQTHADHGDGLYDLEEMVKHSLRDYRISQHFQTSIHEGRHQGIEELSQAIKAAIPWDTLPEVVSSQLFENIREFLQGLQKTSDMVITPIHNLYEQFRDSGIRINPQFVPDLREQFETCIEFLEASGFMRRFKFNRLVLIKPELLDFYASAIINAARSEKIDGFGRLRESTIWNAEFPISEVKRLNRDDEQWLLLATVDDLLTHEIARREEDNLLIFPSQLVEGSTHRQIEHDGPPRVIYTFRGTVANIYSALFVRLARSGEFRLKDSARHNAQFVNKDGHVFGIALEDDHETQGELLLFFSEDASQFYRYLFDLFIDGELKKEAQPGSVARRPLFSCSSCHYPFPEEMTMAREKRGKDDITCPVCDTHVLLVEPFPSREMKKQLDATRASMVRVLDHERRRETAKTTLSRKIEIGNYDVVILNNRQNTKDVESANTLNKYLEERGIYAWYENAIRPAEAAAYLREKGGAAAALIGSTGLAGFVEQDIQRLMKYCASIGKPFIFIITPEARDIPQDLLRQREGVHMAYFFRDLGETSALDDLEKWITGIDPR